MARSVRLETVSLKEYEGVAPPEELEGIMDLAEDLSGGSVLHVNATAYGGGPAEMLARLVPLMQDVGLDADWMVLEGSDEFFQITKSIHNSLHGSKIKIDADKMQTYLSVNKANAETLPVGTDCVVIHDPQPAPIIDFTPRNGGVWAWRCHIDLSRPHRPTWDLLSPYVKRYDSLIFTLKKYVLEELKEIPTTFIPPSIDPVAEKNRHVDDDTIADVLDKREIDADRPTITQVSRYDPWKDPLGVIDVYRLVKRKIPDVQLVMVGSMASDDPEGSVFYENTVRHAGDDPEIRLLTNLPDLEVNAIQRASDVVLQKSVREGFGLTVTEAMWKKRAVVANNVGGIRAQIKNRETGFLVNTTEGMAERTILLLEHPEKRREMGERAHEYVKRNFLMTRLLRQYLELFQGMSDTGRL